MATDILDAVTFCIKLVEEMLTDLQPDCQNLKLRLLEIGQVVLGQLGPKSVQPRVNLSSVSRILECIFCENVL